jgi:hypothetical protein
VLIGPAVPQQKLAAAPTTAARAATVASRPALVRTNATPTAASMDDGA